MSETELGASIAELTSNVGEMRDTRQTEAEWEANPIENAVEYAKQVSREHGLEINFRELNWEMFGGTRSHGKFVWSERTGLTRTTQTQTIKLSRNTLKNHDVAEMKHTIRHELIHAWQCQNNQPIDHGPSFAQWQDDLDVTVYADCRPDAQ